MSLDADKLEMRINRFMIWFLANWIWVASGWAALVVLGAIVTPILAANGFDTLSWLLYKAYRILCPQRPDHSWFISGHKMGFEQRDTSMFVAGAVGGPLYMLVRGDWRISWKIAVLASVPMLIDVATQVVGWRDSDGFWRAWTGGLAVLGFIAWMYPRLDADFRQGLARLKEEERQRENPHLTLLPEPSGNPDD